MADIEFQTPNGEFVDYVDICAIDMHTRSYKILKRLYLTDALKRFLELPDFGHGDWMTLNPKK